MRTKYFLIIVFGTLAYMLVMDGLVLQLLMNHDSNLAYARDSRPEIGADPHGNPHRRAPAQEPTLFPEPSILILLCMGATGVHLFSKHRKDKR